VPVVVRVRVQPASQAHRFLNGCSTASCEPGVERERRLTVALDEAAHGDEVDPEPEVVGVETVDNWLLAAVCRRPAVFRAPRVGEPVSMRRRDRPRHAYPKVGFLLAVVRTKELILMERWRLVIHVHERCVRRLARLDRESPELARERRYRVSDLRFGAAETGKQEPVAASTVAEQIRRPVIVAKTLKLALRQRNPLGLACRVSLRPPRSR